MVSVMSVTTNFTDSNTFLSFRNFIIIGRAFTHILIKIFIIYSWLDIYKNKRKITDQMIPKIYIKLEFSEIFFDLM